MQVGFCLFDNGQFVVLVGAGIGDVRPAVVGEAGHSGPRIVINGGLVVAHGALDLVCLVLSILLKL